MGRREMSQLFERLEKDGGGTQKKNKKAKVACKQTVLVGTLRHSFSTGLCPHRTTHSSNCRLEVTP